VGNSHWRLTETGGNTTRFTSSEYSGKRREKKIQHRGGGEYHPQRKGHQRELRKGGKGNSCLLQFLSQKTVEIPEGKHPREVQESQDSRKKGNPPQGEEQKTRSCKRVRVDQAFYRWGGKSFYWENLSLRSERTFSWRGASLKSSKRLSVRKKGGNLHALLNQAHCR